MNAMQTKVLAKTRQYVDRYGYVKLAHALDMRDTGGIKKWFRENAIPKMRLLQLEEYLKDKRFAKIKKENPNDINN